jgi:hypothetical protein
MPEPYAPVRKQLLNLLRVLNTKRQRAGHPKIPATVLRLRRRIVRPFEARRQTAARKPSNLALKPTSFEFATPAARRRVAPMNLRGEKSRSISPTQVSATFSSVYRARVSPEIGGVHRLRVVSISEPDRRSSSRSCLSAYSMDTVKEMRPCCLTDPPMLSAAGTARCS